MHQTLGAGVKTRSGKIPDSRMATCSGVATLPCTTKILSAQAHACQQRLTPSSLLCTEAIREHSNQSSKLVAALRCEAESDANCSPVWPALARATLPTKAAAFLFALHGSHQRAPQRVEQACGCSAVRRGCKLMRGGP